MYVVATTKHIKYFDVICQGVYLLYVSVCVCAYVNFVK